MGFTKGEKEGRGKKRGLDRDVEREGKIGAGIKKEGEEREIVYTGVMSRPWPCPSFSFWPALVFPCVLSIVGFLISVWYIR